MLETMLNGYPVEVRDLDAERLLDFAAEAEVRERQAGRAKLRAAAQWCVLHPATAESGFVTWSDTGLPRPRRDRRSTGRRGDTAGGGVQLLVPGRRKRSRPWTGSPTRRNPSSSASLPRYGSNGSAPNAARARKIAQATHNLSKAGAASVDAQLADRIGSCGWQSIEFAVAHAIATYDPHLLETREKHGRDAWNVRLYHRGVGTDGADDWVGTSHLEVTGDTLDLTTFHDMVCEQAAQLKALGDADTLEVRKAKAVGVIANRQAALDLGTLLDEPSPGYLSSRCRLRPRPSSTSTCA